MKSILDPTFVYTKAERTDIRKTFERVRAEMKPPTKRRVIMNDNEQSVLRYVAKRRREDRD